MVNVGRRNRLSLLRPGRLGLAEAFVRAGAAHGERIAHRLDGSLPYPWLPRSALTFLEVRDFVARAARVLEDDLGVVAGDRVIVSPANRIDAFWWVLAVASVGAVAVPVHAASGREELAWIAEDSGAVALITDADLWRQRVGRKAALPGIREVGFCDGVRPRRGFHALAQLVGSAPPLATVAPVGEGDPAVILYTSGTTGRPRGALLSHRALLSGLGWAAAVPSVPRQFVVEALPIAHIMGFVAVLTAFLSGVPLMHLRRFRAEDVLDAIESEGATAYVGVPTTYRRLQDEGAAHRDLRTVRTWMSAADLMPHDLIAAFQSYGRALTPGLPVQAIFVEAYGMVEAGGAAMFRVSPPGRSPTESGFVGIPLPGWSVRIVDADSQPKAAGETGELELQGPGVLSSYLGDESSSQAAVRDTWLRTGDLAYKDRLGLVHFAGRSKDVIKSGGFSVFPTEVETLLRAHPQIGDVTVFGVPDPRLGERVVAAVVMADGATIDNEALLEWGRGAMARYKVPRRLFRVTSEEVPMGPTRKVLRRALAERFAAAATEAE